VPSFIKLIQLEIRGIVGELLKIAFCEDFVSWIYVWIFIESGNILKDVGFCIWQVIRVAFYVNRWLIISRKKLYHSVWNGVILERLIISHLVKKFSESYATRRSLPCSQESDHLSISWVILTQFTPCNLDSLISIIIYFHSCLVLSTFHLPPHQNFVFIYIFPYIFAAPPPHLILLDWIAPNFCSGQIMMLFFMHYSPDSFYLLSLTPSFPLHPIREHPQPTFFP